MEPLLRQDASPTYTVFPIKYGDIWEMYKKAQCTYWLPEEVNLVEDVRQWERVLTDSERRFLSHVLAFFAVSDGIVSLNLVQQFLRKVKNQEASFFYAFQNLIENIHAEMYGRLIDELIKDDEEKNRLLRAIETVPVVESKARWALKWTEDEHASFVEQLVAFALVEGVFFASAFASIFWFRKRGLMPGLTFSNELISRDEALHCRFACLLYRDHVVEKLTDARVEGMFREAVEIEKKFFSAALPADLPGMNADYMGRYVEFVADQLLRDLGHKAIYLTENPFDFMQSSALENKTNFFERKVSSYQKSNLYAPGARFQLDAEF